VISKGFEELWNIVKKKYAQTNTKKKAFEIYQTLITEGIEHSVLFRALIAYNEEFEANGYDTRYYVSLHRFLDRDEVYGWYDEQEKYLRTQMARETHRTIAKEERIKQEKLDAEQRRIDALCEVDPEAKHLHDLTFAPGQTMTERSQARSVWLDYLHKHLTEKERVVA
jgi:hypothetical protein